MAGSHALLGAFIGVAAALAGCGAAPAASPTTASSAAKAPDPVAWMSAYCQGIAPVLKNRAELLDVGGAGPGKGMAAVKGYLDLAGPAMVDTAAKLTELGSPAAAAEALHLDLVDHLTRKGEVIHEVREVIKRMEAGERTVPEADLVRDASNQAELLDHLFLLTDVPALKDAYAKAPPCVELKAVLESFEVEVP